MAYLYPFQLDIAGVHGSGNPANLLVSDNNRTVENTGGGNYITLQAVDLAGKESGKWYWETISVNAGSNNTGYGIAKSGTTNSNYIGDNATSYSVFSDGLAYHNGSLGGHGLGSFTVAGERVHHKLDMDAGTYEAAGDDGVFVTIGTGLTGRWVPAISIGNSRKTEMCLTLAHQRGINGSVPAGFLPFDERTTYPHPLVDFNSGGASIDIDTYGRTFYIISGSHLQARTNTDVSIKDTLNSLIRTSGKWYWETRTRSTFVSTNNNETEVGIIPAGDNFSSYLGIGGNDVGCYQRTSNSLKSAGSNIGELPGTAASRQEKDAVVRHSLDLDAGTYSIAVNDSAWQVVRSNIVGTDNWMPIVGGVDGSNPAIVELNLSPDTLIYGAENGESLYQQVDGTPVGGPDPLVPEFYSASPFQFDTTDVDGNGNSGFLTMLDNNRTIANSGSNGSNYLTLRAVADAGKSSGKWYWETINRDGAASIPHIGVGIALVGADTGSYLGVNTNGYSVFSNGTRYHNGNDGSSGVIDWKAAGSRLYHRLDLDNGTYSVAGPDKVFVEVTTGLTGNWIPAISVQGNTKAEICLTLANCEGINGAVPAGYKTFDERNALPLQFTELGGSVTKSGFGRIFNSTANAWQTARGDITITPDTPFSFIKTSGKWYWETRTTSVYSGGNSNEAIVGIIPAADLLPTFIGTGEFAIGLAQRDDIYRQGILIGTQPGTAAQLQTAPAIVRHLLDLDVGTYSIANGDSAFAVAYSGIDATKQYMPGVSGNDIVVNQLCLSPDAMTYGPDNGDWLLFDELGANEIIIDELIPEFYSTSPFQYDTTNLLGNGSVGTIELSDNNRTFQSNSTTGVYQTYPAVPGASKSTGKWYWETVNRIQHTGSSQIALVGINQTGSAISTYLGSGATQYSVGSNGQKYNNGPSTAGIVPNWGAVGSRTYHKLDLDNGTYSVAGPDKVFAEIATGLTGNWIPACCAERGNKVEICLTLANCEGVDGLVPNGYKTFDERNALPLQLTEFGSGSTINGFGRVFQSNTNGWKTSRGDDNTTFIDIPESFIKTTGKWYWETRTTSIYGGVNSNEALVGIMPAEENLPSYIGSTDLAVGASQRGLSHWSNASQNALPGTPAQIQTAPAVIRHLLDIDAGTYTIANADSAFAIIRSGLLASTKYMPGISGNGITVTQLCLSPDAMTYGPDNGDWLLFDELGANEFVPLPYSWAFNVTNVLGNGLVDGFSTFSETRLMVNTSGTVGIHTVLEATDGLGKSK